MRIALSGLAVSMFLWGVPHPAGADPITIRLDRSVSVGASVAVLGEDVENESSQSDGDSLFTTITVSSGPAAATGSQSLSSVLSHDARQFSATGRTGVIVEVSSPGDGTNAGAGGNAFITWDFGLEQPELFDFDSALTTSSDNLSVIFRTSLAAVHDSQFEPVFSDESLFTHGGTTSHHGRLDAGLYSFFFQSSAGLFVFDGSNTARMSFDFNLDLAPAAQTPEPDTMSLIGGGLAAVAVRLRKRRLRA